MKEVMMKVLKNVLIGIMAVIVLVLLVALILPQNYAVKREIEISQSKEVVFGYVKYLRNQDNYSRWASMDSKMKKEFRGTDGVVGFVSVWDSENVDVGKGEQEIMEIVEGERIEFELRFIKPFEATDMAYITTESLSDNSTKVAWGFDGKMNYPMNIMLPFLKMDKMLGKDLQDGLDKLKLILEEEMEKGDPKIIF